MNDALTRRQVVTVILMLLAHGSITTVDAKARDVDNKWMAPLQHYGWDTSELKNKVQHGDVTTYELGTPNYQILNPEDEPEFITEDQPHYKEMLRRLTSNANATDTIDIAMPSASASASVSATAVEDSRPTPKWEKLKKRSHPSMETKQTEVEAVPLDKISRQSKIHVYAGARPFQKRIANLS